MKRKFTLPLGAVAVLLMMGLFTTQTVQAQEDLNYEPLNVNIIDNTLEHNRAQNMPDADIPEVIGQPEDGERFAPMSSFCDDFNVPNTTTITGWTEQSGDWQVFDNKLQTPGTTSWDYMTADGSSQVDGCITARAIYGSPAEVKFVGLVGRYVSLGTKIHFKIQDNGSISGEWDTYFVIVDGTYISSGNGSFGTDAIIQMEYAGANVTVRIDTDRDGIWEVTDTFTVSNISVGLCGVSAYKNAFIDDFCCGDDCSTVTPSVPISNWAIIIGLLLIGAFIVVRYRTRLA